MFPALGTVTDGAYVVYKPSGSPLATPKRGNCTSALPPSVVKSTTNALADAIHFSKSVRLLIIYSFVYVIV